MPDQPRFLHTSKVEAEHLEHLEEVRVCAHLFQEMIPKAMDLRVVVVGRQVFAVGIHSHSSESALDWRRAYGDLTYSTEQLPSQVEQQLLQLVCQFGLQYSSADFILTPDGEYIFVELNPNGQFYWLEPPTGLPMAEALADLLAQPEDYQLC
jgi:glutathione synthase/RimK-type ligase-like ATP-grasp enzyme